MIVDVLRLTRWEWFKLRKRWMPWILLTIVVILTQISVWGGFSAYQSSRAPLAAEFRASSLINGDGGGLADSGRWSTVVVMLGKAVYGLVPYVVLALFLSVLTSSSSMGIAISLAYYFVEAILVRILGGLFDWFNNVSDLLLGPNVIAWMTEAEVQATGGDAALFALKDLPGQLHSFVVVTAYIAVLGGAAVWIMERRDIAGARGE